MNTLPAPMQDRLDALVTRPDYADSNGPGAAARAEASNLLELQRLQQSAAYFDSTHIDHEVVKNKVRRMYELEYGGQLHGRRPVPYVFDTTKP